MITIKVEEVRKVACVGAGTIGSAWAAYFLSRGLEVVATDPALEAETRLRANIDEAWPKLERLGLSTDANREKLSFIKDVKQAVTQVDFIQESAPDEEALKIDLISKIDAYCRIIKKIRQQILELERQKLLYGECDFCTKFDFNIIKK